MYLIISNICKKNRIVCTDKKIAWIACLLLAISACNKPDSTESVNKIKTTNPTSDLRISSSTLLTPQVTTEDYFVEINALNFEKIMDAYYEFFDEYRSNLRLIWNQQSTSSDSVEGENAFTTEVFNCPLSGSFSRTEKTNAEVDDYKLFGKTDLCFLESGAFNLEYESLKTQDKLQGYMDISYSKDGLLRSINHVVNQEGSDQLISEKLMIDPYVGTFFMRTDDTSNPFQYVYGANDTFFELRSVDKINDGRICAYTVSVNGEIHSRDYCPINLDTNESSSTLFSPQLTEQDYTLTIDAVNYKRVVDSYYQILDEAIALLGEVYSQEVTEQSTVFEGGDEIIVSTGQCSVSGGFTVNKIQNEVVETIQQTTQTENCVIDSSEVSGEVSVYSYQSNLDGQTIQRFDISYYKNGSLTNMKIEIFNNEYNEIFVNDASLGTYFVRLGKEDPESFYGANASKIDINSIEQYDGENICEYTAVVNETDYLVNDCPI